jgi:hypothetical protein
MRKLVSAAVLTVVMLVFGSGVANAQIPGSGFQPKNVLLIVGFGTFTPGGDYEPIGKEEWQTGPDFNVAVGLLFHEFLGFEVGMHGYGTEIGNDTAGFEVSAVGLEFLLTIQPREARFQPFVGLGLGSYSTIITTKLLGYRDERSYSGSGGVFKAGLRYFVGENFHMGFSVKAFSNNVQDDYGNTADFGGTAFNFELGGGF